MARAEAYRVSYDKTTYHAPIPQGHDRQITLANRASGIESNILRYLGEYRLGVKFDEFFYRETTNSLTGEVYFSTDKEESSRDKYRRAVWARKKEGLSTRREVAECLGFEKLEKDLLASPDGALFVWVSPPGSKEEGYGNYSFTFVGQKLADKQTGESHVRVVPYRNILSQKEHKDYLRFFDERAGDFKSDVDFLANPVVFSPSEYLRVPEDVIRAIGEEEKISTSWLGRLKNAIGLLLQRFMHLVKEGASDNELTKVKFAMENYVISIRDMLEGSNFLAQGLEKTIELWGNHEPPKAAGSCGSTLEEFHEGSNKPWEYHHGDCVACGAIGVPVGPCSICKRCEVKFDQEEKNS